MKNETRHTVVREQEFYEMVRDGKVIATLAFKLDLKLKAIFIESLVVWEEAYRGMGIGRNLVEKLIRQGAIDGRFDAVLVSAAPDAVAFYLKVGFKQTSRNCNNMSMSLKS